MAMGGAMGDAHQANADTLRIVTVVCDIVTLALWLICDTVTGPARNLVPTARALPW